MEQFLQALGVGRLGDEIGRAEGAGMAVRYEGGRTVSAWEVRDLQVRGDAAAMEASLTEAQRLGLTNKKALANVRAALAK